MRVTCWTGSPLITATSRRNRSRPRSNACCDGPAQRVATYRLVIPGGIVNPPDPTYFYLADDSVEAAEIERLVRPARHGDAFRRATPEGTYALSEIRSGN